MYRLTRKYNRVYYRRVFMIQVRKHWKLKRLWVINKLMKLCVKIDKESTDLIFKESFKAGYMAGYREGFNDNAEIFSDILSRR